MGKNDEAEMLHFTGNKSIKKSSCSVLTDTTVAIGRIEAVKGR